MTLSPYNKSAINIHISKLDCKDTKKCEIYKKKNRKVF